MRTLGLFGIQFDGVALGIFTFCGHIRVPRVEIRLGVSTEWTLVGGLDVRGVVCKVWGRRGLGGKNLDIGGGGRNFVGQVHFVFVQMSPGMRGHDSWRVGVSGVRGTGRYVRICAILLTSNEKVVSTNVTVVHPRMLFWLPGCQTMCMDPVHASMKFYGRPCSGAVCVAFVVVQKRGCGDHFSTHCFQ